MSEKDGRSWSMDEIDNLLKRTAKPAKKDGKSVSDKAGSVRLADSSEAAETIGGGDEDIKIYPTKGLNNKKAGNISISSEASKKRVSDTVNRMNTGEKSGRKKDSDQTSMFDEPLTPKKKHSMETDEIRRRFLDKYEIPAEEEDPVDESKTRVIERPGFVVKRGKVNESEDLEEVPTIIDADAAKKDRDLLKEKTDDGESWSDGQIRFPDFDIPDNSPVIVNEKEAEEKLKKTRRTKINDFKLSDIGEEEETNRIIEKLFTDESLFGKKNASDIPNNAGVEYTNPKDAHRIKGTLLKLKRLSLMKLIGFTAITAVMLLLNIVSCVSSGYDTTLLQLANLLLLIFCLVLGANCINDGVVAIFKRDPDIKSAVTVASLAALVQNICILLGSGVLNYHSFMLSGCAAAAFALNEYGEYLRHSRTYDALCFCTGKMKKKLFSIQEIEDKNEKFEIGRNLLMDSPDIRYSCRAKFPARLIGQCESDVSADKLQSILMPIIIAGSLICGIIGGIITGDFLYGVTSWAGAMCVCIPAFGLASIQLPMRWANRRLNKAGGLITGQHAIENYSTANSIVIDSTELFDQDKCVLHGFKHFGRVRVDDIMLYAAAIALRAGGPLSKVFGQVVTEKDLLPEVHSFSYEDRMGVSGWIDEQKVIMGNRKMMEHHNFSLEGLEEEKYTHNGRRVIYIAIANNLAAMIVVSYAPNKKLTQFIRRLGADGVTILLRNNDSNVTTDMINETFGVKFDNIRLISNTAGRLYKKYRSKVRDQARSGIIHDGTAFSFMRSFTMSYTLCGTFKAENLIQLVNVLAGMLVAGILAALKVFTYVGMWPLLLFQVIMAVTSFTVARLRGLF